MVIYIIVLDLDVVCVGRQPLAEHVRRHGHSVGPGGAGGDRVVVFGGGWRGPGTTDGAGAGVEVVVVDCFCCACQQPAKPNGTASMSRNLQEAFESGRDWLRCTYLLWSWSKWLRAELFARSAATVRARRPVCVAAAPRGPGIDSLDPSARPRGNCCVAAAPGRSVLDSACS